MNTKIDAEFWNSLTPLQKRVAAENLTVETRDYGEILAWASTLALSAAIVAFTLIIVR
ncbi:MAG TPA: hypothetical protein VK737_04115 [Opitutales bacterium]|jgi:hypothetical protein|nr:hypothetical protein [Opitutales bacterium]